jgi:hypothetical protein
VTALWLGTLGSQRLYWSCHKWSYYIYGFSGVTLPIAGAWNHL